MAIEDYIFPAHSLGSKAAAKGVLGLGPMGMGDMDQTSMLLGLLAPMFLGGQQQDSSAREEELAAMSPEQFLAGEQGQQPVQQGQSQPDPLEMLSMNIAKRFGGQ